MDDLEHPGHALNRLLPNRPLASSLQPKASLLRLVSSFLDRTLYRDGFYRAVGNRGIGRGSPLSPLLGAVYLAEMDEKLSALADRDGLFYARFMDDWVILAPTRWKLRRAIHVTNQCLEQLKVKQHPDKTFIGRAGQGFDFLGYQFDEGGLIGLSRRSIGRFAENIARRISAGNDSGQVASYVRRWWSWAMGGLDIKKPEEK